MPTKIRKLKITCVAACQQGACYDPATEAGAHILLFKTADPEVHKQEGVTVGDVYPDTFAGTAHCSDPDCDDPQCPVHGALVRARRRKKQRVAKGPVSEMGMHREPDGDEEPPLDYQTRGQQYDLWECLWQKWQTFTTTFHDCCGDWDVDNVPHLHIFVDSIGQFQDDVAQLLQDCGVAKAVQPHLNELTGLCTSLLTKAGAAMAGHRLTRMRDAIAALQQILEECTPEELPHGITPPINRAGVSAAEVLGMQPALMKGDNAMAENSLLVAPGTVAQAQLDAMTIRAETAEARVAELEPLVAKVASLETTLTKMQQTPEEQEAAYWASVPEPVRKKHEADEAEKVELRKQLQDAREEREQTVYIAKTADYRGFGLVQKHWTLLKRIEQWPEDERDEMLRLMKASSARDATADLFRASGSDGRNGSSGAGDGASATDQIQALTEAYMEEKGVDFLKASAAIVKSHPELYRRSRDERGVASRVQST